MRRHAILLAALAATPALTGTATAMEPPVASTGGAAASIKPPAPAAPLIGEARRAVDQIPLAAELPALRDALGGLDA